MIKDMLQGKGVTTLLLIAITCTPCGASESASETPSSINLAKIEQYLEDGQNVLAKEVAKEWVTLPEVDRKVMSKACALLSDKQLHETAVVLLERLDWIMPTECSWPTDTLLYMQKQGMDEAIDKALTYGTALTAEEDTRPQVPDAWIEGYKTAVVPRSASRLFSFYGRDKDQLEELFTRYGRELEKRPSDVRLISEYAYWLAQKKQIDKAVEVIGRIDCTKLDLLTLYDLGAMWDPQYDDPRLIACTIGPLERALTLEMSDKEAHSYTSGWQAIVSTPMAKRLFHERMIMALARRYVRIDSNENARKMYEQYLALPRRERWGDRTQAQKEYAEVLAKLGQEDTYRNELESKAQSSGLGKDWAELAAYLQGRHEIENAKEAWEKAIAATKPTPREFKAERPREGYRRTLIKMLDENKMYDEEIRVLKDALDEQPWDYGSTSLLHEIAKAYLKLDRKDEAIAFLMAKLDEHFDMEIVYLIVRTDHEKALFEGYSIGHNDTEMLPSWSLVLKKINQLDDPEKSESLAAFYSRYYMYAEYVDLVEQMPQEQVDGPKMSRLVDHAYRCARYDRAVYWGKKILEHAGTTDFPAKGSREYINTLENISACAAKSGDFDTSLEYAEKLCLLVPERFYFAESLAECAKAQDKKNELVSRLNALAQQHPNRWVVWRVLADVYKVFGDAANVKLCQQNIDLLK